MILFECDREAKRVKDRAELLLAEVDEAWEAGVLSSQAAMYIIDYSADYLHSGLKATRDVKDTVFMSVNCAVQILNLLLVIHGNSYDSIFFYVALVVQVVLLLILVNLAKKDRLETEMMKKLISLNDTKLDELIENMREMIFDNKMDRI